MITELEYDNLIEEFYENPDFFSGIFQQLVCEKRYGGFNFPAEFEMFEWHGPTIKGKDGSIFIAKYWMEA